MGRGQDTEAGLASCLPPTLKSSQPLGGYGTSSARVRSELQAKSASLLPLGELEPATLDEGTQWW